MLPSVCGAVGDWTYLRVRCVHSFVRGDLHPSGVQEAEVHFPGGSHGGGPVAEAGVPEATEEEEGRGGVEGGRREVGRGRETERG